MCNQTVSLVAGEVERSGIPTVAIQLLREVAERVGPPRALFVPFRHGFTLDVPNDPERQKRVLRAALRLLHDPAAGPRTIADYEESVH